MSATFFVKRQEIGDVNPPVRIASGLISQNYSDETVVSGKSYKYWVGASVNGIEKISDEITVFAGGDPYWDKVVALVRFDDNVINLKGSPWSSLNPVFEAGKFNKGIRFNGVDNRFAGFQANNSSQNFEDLPFTIDLWVKIVSNAPSNVYVGVISKRNSYNTMSFSLAINPNSSTLNFEIFTGTSTWNGGTFPTLALGVFQFISIERDGNTLRGYLNGSIIWERQITGKVRVSSVPIVVGRIDNGWAGGLPNIVLDEVRITKGEARYKGIHVVPTEPFPAF